MKKVIVVILVILLTIVGGLVVPILLNRNTSNANTQPTEASHTNSGEQTPTPSAIGDETHTITGSITSTNKPLNTATQETLVTPTANVTDETNDLPSATHQQRKGSQEWIERKIQEHRDEILDEDLSDFRRIYSKVDMGYVQSFGSDGYSDEETEKVKQYLRDTLGGDYQRAQILYYRYSYILNEE